MFANKNVEKNVKERFVFKNYNERFERSLHLCILYMFIFSMKSRKSRRSNTHNKSSALQQLFIFICHQLGERCNNEVEVDLKYARN